MTIEEEREYILNGGDLFRIKKINTIRDFKIDLIETSIDYFYLDNKTHTFHTHYPTNKDNEIKDLLLCKYLVKLLGNYAHDLQFESERINRNLSEIQL